MAKDLDRSIGSKQGTESLLHSLRELIHGAREKAIRAADAVQVQTCWEIGRHIVEFEQGGATRAEYGTRLLSLVARSLNPGVRARLRRDEPPAHAGLLSGFPNSRRTAS